MTRFSVAMTSSTDVALREHLLRADGQEDLCLATYRPSSGRKRRTAVLREVMLPREGERAVHGNATFTGDYVLRVAAAAKADSSGVALLHSHPAGSGWQRLSGLDTAAESSYSHLVNTVTGLPFVGLTLAGDDAWSARFWMSNSERIWCENVRVLGPQLRVFWNDRLRPPPLSQDSQVRTVSAWGEGIQADMARLRVLVVGAGSVGLDVALRLAATGIESIAVMDYDTVELVNLDRLIGATRSDVALRRSKAEIAERLMRGATTAAKPDLHAHELSVGTPEGLAVALDFDVLFSCVDRPWPRGVLNTIAYADLVPVIDGGIAIDAFDDGGGMRNATWRTHVLRPGRPCVVCNGQADPAEIVQDRLGLFDDPDYIARAAATRAPGGPANSPARENVAVLSAGVSASLLSQFVSLVVAPGGIGDPGPLRYWLSTHTLERMTVATRPHCTVEKAAASGDLRPVLTGPHPAANDRIAERRQAQSNHRQRMRRLGTNLFLKLSGR